MYKCTPGKCTPFCERHEQRVDIARSRITRIPGTSLFLSEIREIISRVLLTLYCMTYSNASKIREWERETAQARPWISVFEIRNNDNGKNKGYVDAVVKQLRSFARAKL